MLPLYVPKIAVITGSTSGFGLETAKKLAALGTKLVLTGRRIKRLEALKEQLDVPVHIMVQNICDTDQVMQDFQNLPDEFKDVELLVNNAGLALGTEPFQDKHIADSLAMVDTNIRGLLAVTHALIPGMAARKKAISLTLAQSLVIMPIRAATHIAEPRPLLITFPKTCAPI